MWIQLATLAFLGSQYFKAKKASAPVVVAPPTSGVPNAIYKIDNLPINVPKGEAMYTPPDTLTAVQPGPAIFRPLIISPPETSLPPWTPSPVTLNNPIVSPLSTGPLDKLSTQLPNGSQIWIKPNGDTYQVWPTNTLADTNVARLMA